MTDAPVQKPTHRRKSLFFQQLVAERRRAAISFTIGLIVLLAVQIPAVEQSFLGAPDREMMETAFKIRADVTAGVAEPVLFLDFDDRTIGKITNAPFSAPPVATPREVIAELLDFIRTAPPADAPRVVVLDVDIAQGTLSAAEAPTPGLTKPATVNPDLPDAALPPDVAALKGALSRWASTRTAPPLIIARQSYPNLALGLPGQGLALPDTPYDAVVAAGPNIYWSAVKFLSDQNGVIREFLPFECVLTRAGVQPLYAAALLAYGFAERDAKVLDRAPARHWIADGPAHCQSQPYDGLIRGERVDYHFSLDAGASGRVWPNLSPKWPGFAQCKSPDAAIFRQISVIDVDDALKSGADISRDLLCQHIVVIGGTNAGGEDFVQTPIGKMNGTVVLANAIRGLELTHGGLRPIWLPFQVVSLMLVSIAISVTAAATEHARRRYRRLKRGRHKRKLSQRIGVIGLNPIILNGTIALMAHVTGIVLLSVSLNFGLWGFLSAPAFASAITETVQEFFDG
jgi:CHASE2 domain-containing sensor protein